ncbi:DMT family transporter [Marinobacter xestospongiae]|uniref:DMT family transporter n=1 Tax=Marinobacter xestospongiae TaxID=994319 RepID=A0ABU3VV33_9GAMM|nr:DMT family transporter [Marinobacter xestospongiae]MDV2078124.1 DMT family transporter [Marinobacter xestospongiae]
MHIPAAYLTVVLVWATTPLGIALSGATLHPILAGALRMAIAAVLGLLLVAALRIPLRWRGPALRSYGWALLGVYAALSLSYLAAQSVPSGLISVLYGLSPMVSAVLARWLVNEPAMPAYKWLACGIALTGLVVLFGHDLAVGSARLSGLLMLLVAVFLFSLSAVMVKRTDARSHPLAQTVGTVVLSVPLFVLTWWLLDGQAPTLDWASPSPWAVLYLAVFGSLLGFVSYFHVLHHLPASTVALVTLITPVFAMALGHWFNDEVLSATVLQGSGLILVGLAVFFFGGRWKAVGKVAAS